MSNGAKKLETLAPERENILLAEVAALLHDIGKFCDRHYEVHSLESQSLSPMPDFAYKVIVDDPSNVFSCPTARETQGGGNIYDELVGLHNTVGDKAADYLNSCQKQSLLNTEFVLFGVTFSLAEMILIARPKFARPSLLTGYLGKNAWLIALLGSCHREAHYDKQGPEEGQQSFTNVRLSTSFGFEGRVIQVDGKEGSLTARLKKLPFNRAKNHQEIRESLRQELTIGLGDTRRPINEVDLWSWSSVVASLFKAEIANALLLNQPRKNLMDVKWRLLRITYNGLAFLERAPTIGDMLGRQAALTDALDRVRHLLEYEYPLGNEVYRDEHGSAFVVPALDGDDGEGTMLHGLIDTHIRNAFDESNLWGEVEPQILISHASKEAKELHTLLQKPLPPTHPFTEDMHRWWQGEPADICTVCGVRPQGWGTPTKSNRGKAKERNVCYVCLGRRDTRAEVWAKGREKDASEEQREQWQHTVWIDEVADNNGRLVLIVGHFDLDQWLSGDMIQTMLVVCNPPNSNFTRKNPSFARIQRVWRTTQQFWQDVWNEDVGGTFSEKHARLEISVSNTPNLGAYHTYDVEINGKLLSVIWDSEKKCLITADNLHPWGGAEQLREQLQQMQQQPLSLSEPGGYGKQRKSPTSVTIDRVDLLSSAYTPAVKLLTEPRSFMALVPAAKAVEVASKIYHRYECEMSKVHNRLPMHLGLVFFGRRQPLFSALDAGRRMLDIPIGTEVKCTVCASNQDTTPPEDLQHPHFNRWQEISLQNNDNSEQYVWRVSTVMGDGKTEDHWYPYARIDEAVSQGTQEIKQFTVDDKQWLHVDHIEQGQHIYFTPSRFSYLFLDTSARRFEVGRDESLPLEELEQMRELWKKLKELAEKGKLSESKLHATVALLRSKDEEWQAYEQNNREIYQNFVDTVLRKEGLIEAVTVKDVTSRRLLRTFELYQQILKERLPKVKQPSGEGTV